MKRPIARPGAQFVLGLESEPLEPLIESDTPELVWGRLSQELIHRSWPAVMELSAVWRRLDL
jgi:hypothetical protein